MITLPTPLTDFVSSVTVNNIYNFSHDMSISIMQDNIVQTMMMCFCKMEGVCKGADMQ